MLQQNECDMLQKLPIRVWECEGSEMSVSRNECVTLPLSVTWQAWNGDIAILAAQQINFIFNLGSKFTN